MHVMEKVVVSGSRDRGISVWSIEQVDIIIIYHHLCTKIITSIFVIAIISSQVVAGGEANSKPCSRNPDMHKGWVRTKIIWMIVMVTVFSPQVWSFCSEGETLVSGKPEECACSKRNIVSQAPGTTRSSSGRSHPLS